MLFAVLFVDGVKRVVEAMNEDEAFEAATWQAVKALPVKQLRSITVLHCSQLCGLHPEQHELYTLADDGCPHHGESN